MDEDITIHAKHLFAFGTKELSRRSGHRFNLIKRHQAGEAMRDQSSTSGQSEFRILLQQIIQYPPLTCSVFLQSCEPETNDDTILPNVEMTRA